MGGSPRLGGRQARKEFRFANEKSAEREDEPVELPNPLASRRSIN